MSGWRLPAGGEIDRQTKIDFTFDGRQFHGHPGDTVASALLASGQRILGRSFKYHRPRGIWGAGLEEPNAIMDVRSGDIYMPNTLATRIDLAPGMSVSSVNTGKAARNDWLGVLDRFHWFLPAGFYYKTFIWPNWAKWEPSVRRMAGLGKIDPEYHPPADCPRIATRCQLLVVGAGPAGLAAAAAAASSGIDVMLADDGPRAGGSLRWSQGEAGGRDWHEWVCEQIDTILRCGGRILTGTTVWGLFDHDLFAAWERRVNNPDRMWNIQAERTILASGAIERPLWFTNNDLPGIMSVEAAARYLAIHAVAPGRNIVVATTGNAPWRTAGLLANAGCRVVLLDYRERPHMAAPAGVEVLKGTRILAARGRHGIRQVITDRGTFDCDCLLLSGGYTPAMHLYMQSRARAKWDPARNAFTVANGKGDSIRLVGGVNGTTDIAGAIEQGHVAGEDLDAPVPPSRQAGPDEANAWPDSVKRGRIWIDFQNDVTLQDLRLAVREGYEHVEHAKRYTTLGMAMDQGKTSGHAGQAVMAELLDKSPGATGTTTFRPPWIPVPLTVVAGLRRGELFDPLKRLPLESRHMEAGGQFAEYGGWLRPACYGQGDAGLLALEEAKIARKSCGILDASSLGKIEVSGPGAGQLLDFCFYNRISTMAVGRARYAFMLGENGVIFDDAVVFRMGQNRYIVSASSSHVEATIVRLEEARQDRFNRKRVHIHDLTAQFATLAVTGPRSAELLSALGGNMAMGIQGLKHMSVVEMVVDGARFRVARVSFSGDRCYELSIGASHAGWLFDLMQTRLSELGGCLLGVEALLILRTEKGYILVGKDTDGLTMPHDIGWDRPRMHRMDEYIGKRSLFTHAARRNDRHQLIGMEVMDEGRPLEVGAHIIERDNGRQSLGYVTSSCMGPAMNRPVAIGLLLRGREIIGEEVCIYNHSETRPATVCSPCFLDPDGSLLHD